MKLTFLGTGTSTGVPSPLCRCAVCRSRDPRDKRLRASALLHAPGGNILIDCGPDFRHQAMRAGLGHVEAVLLTHSHYDHVGGVDDLRAYCRVYADRHGGAPLPVYCTADVADDLRQRVPYCFGDNPYPGVPRLELRVIDREPFQVCGLEVTPLPVVHNKEIRGYLLGRGLAYVTDCKVMPEATKEMVRGVPALVLNALREREHPTHLNLAQSLGVIKETAPGHAYLTHMSDGIGLHEQVQRRLPANVTLAWDGMTTEVSASGQT